MRLDERVLSHLLGISHLARDQVGGPEGDLLVATDERFVGAEVTSAGTLDELGIIELGIIQ